MPRERANALAHSSDRKARVPDRRESGLARVRRLLETEAVAQTDPQPVRQLVAGQQWTRVAQRGALLGRSRLRGRNQAWSSHRCCRNLISRIYATASTTSRSAGCDSCFLAKEQSWRTGSSVRSLLSRTNTSSGEHATGLGGTATALTAGASLVCTRSSARLSRSRALRVSSVGGMRTCAKGPDFGFSGDFLET
jgi:hypothetical protein